MEYVGPFYNYKYWMCMVQYTWSMCRYWLSLNYLQLKDKDQNKGAIVYIDGRPKATGNIVGFIKSTQPGSTIKKPNYILLELEFHLDLQVDISNNVCSRRKENEDTN